MKIAVVTDSTSDIPPGLAAERSICVIPLNVHIGSETYLDGVTLKADEFYKRLQSGGELPTTSQPSAGAFVEAYQKLAESFDAIVSVHISSRVSGTHNSAVQAKEEMSDSGTRIEVVDTLQASMGLGLVALGVADAVKAGANVDETVETAKSLSGRASFFGLVDTLEYLQKGGRIGRAQMYLGSLLRIKPILSLVDGVAHPLDRARTWSRGYARVKEITEEAAPLSALAVMHSTDSEPTDRLASELARLVPGGEVVKAQFGPVLGTYLGPGSIGISLIRATED
ncbi:MAG: DegV family protein [Dehalococcoidia bacterium]